MNQNTNSAGSPYVSGQPSATQPAATGNPGYPQSGYTANEYAVTQMQENYVRINAELAARLDAKKQMRQAAGNERNMMSAIGCLLISLLFADVLIFSEGGIGAFGSFMLAEGIIFFTYREHMSVGRKKALLLALPVLVIAVSFTLFHNSTGYFIPYSTILILMSLQIILLSGSETDEAFSPEMVSLVLRRIVTRPFANMDLYFAAFRVPKDKKTGKTRNLMYVLIGILVAVPFVAILLSLFLSADGIFKQEYYDFLDILKIDLSAGRVFADLFVGSMFALFAGSVLMLNAVGGHRDAARSKMTVRVNSVAGMTFTVVINLLLLAFAAVQARYLLFGGMHALIEEMGYAEYARQGFFQLSWASGIVFVVAAAVLTLTRNESGKSPVAIRISVLLMCTLNMVVALSSAWRMYFYVDAHGLSIKRVSTLFGILVIFISLLWLAAKCLLPQMKSLKMIGISMMVLVLIFSLINVDRLVARYNTERYLDDILTMDAEYFHQLSYTSVAELLELRSEAESGGHLADNLEDINVVLKHYARRFEDRQLLSSTFDDFRVGRLLSDIEFKSE